MIPPVFFNGSTSMAYRTECIPMDKISTRIRKDACMMELRDSFEQYSEVTFAARSLWFVIKTRLPHGLQDAKKDAREMLMYMRSELGLAYGCGPRLNRYRDIMDYLSDVAWGRETMTREGLIGSGKSTEDFCRIADVANQFYVGARWRVIDASYTSSSEDEVDNEVPRDPEPPKKVTDDDIYRFLLNRRVGFHV